MEEGLSFLQFVLKLKLWRLYRANLKA